MTSVKPSILTIDVGTSSLKAVVYSTQGQIVASSTRRYSVHSPQPSWSEGDPEQWWLALREALAELAAKGVGLGQIEALSFTGQMHTAILLDHNQQVIAPTILWLDRRAARETRDLQDQLGLPPFQLNSTYTLPKLLWLYRHRPDVLNRTRTLLWPKDYLRFRLTGEICTDLTEPGGAVLLNWDTRTWALDRLDLVGLDPEVLPPIRPAHGDGGTLLPEIAQDLGLNPEARVVVGMGDVAALFGAAPLQPGRVTCSLGSSSMVFAPLDPDQDIVEPLYRLYTYPFGPLPMLGGVSSTTGSALVWMVEEICRSLDNDLTFEECVAQGLTIEPGAEGLCFIPYLAGERTPYWHDGLEAGFYGLRLAHGWRHMVRAVMEGVAFSLLHLLGVYADLGITIDEIALAGGGAGTEGWPQIFADVCQRDVLLYAGGETVTRVLYALCQVHLDRGRFTDNLLQTFDVPVIIQHRPELKAKYGEGYRRYRAFSQFAWEQAQP